MGERNKEGAGMKMVRVARNLEVYPRVHLLTWRREDNFLPGQVVKIALEEGEAPRIYSLCSGNGEEEMAVLFNVKEEGSLTPRMAALRPGDALLVSAPYGTFLGDEAPAWWIASGTGIAPFYSMFRSGLGGNKTLVHGVRYPGQFYFGEAFEREMGARYVRCATRGEGEHIFQGRVTAWLEKQEQFPADTRYYLCGNPLMVVEARDLLIAGGVPWEAIVAEIYF